MVLTFKRKHAKEILTPGGVDRYTALDKRGVWPKVHRDLSMQAETDLLRWRPARLLQGEPGAPEAADTPMLPFPFTAVELAAFMLAGVGALVADFYGDWNDGPDPDKLKAMDPDSRARTAIVQAFKAYRDAQRIVGDQPLVRQGDVDRLRKAYREANQKANAREGVADAIPGTDDSKSRRSRAEASTAELKSKLDAATAQAQAESEAWLKAMVQQLLQAPPDKSPTTPVSLVVDVGRETWMPQARARAVAIIGRQRAQDLYPSQEHIADEIAKEFRAAGIVGADGKPLSGAYIKRHALNGISSAQGKQLSTQTGRGK
jgi:hypothetical protein